METGAIMLETSSVTLVGADELWSGFTFGHFKAAVHFFPPPCPVFVDGLDMHTQTYTQS